MDTNCTLKTVPNTRFHVVFFMKRLNGPSESWGFCDSRKDQAAEAEKPAELKQRWWPYQQFNVYVPNKYRTQNLCHFWRSRYIKKKLRKDRKGMVKSHGISITPCWDIGALILATSVLLMCNGQSVFAIFLSVAQSLRQRWPSLLASSFYLHPFFRFFAFPFSPFRFVCPCLCVFSLCFLLLFLMANMPTFVPFWLKDAKVLRLRCLNRRLKDATGPIGTSLGKGKSGLTRGKI